MNRQDDPLERVLRERLERIRSRGAEAEHTGGDPYVVFQVQGHTCALPVSDVETLMQVPDMRAIPQMPEAYLGVFDLRGRLHEAFCLESLLGAGEPEGRHLLLIRCGNDRVGLRVGTVEGVRDMASSEWTPLSGNEWPDWLSASTPEPCYLISRSALWETLMNL